MLPQKDSPSVAVSKYSGEIFTMPGKSYVYKR